MGDPDASPHSTATLARLRNRPLGFLFSYVRQRILGHAIVLVSVLLAVVCSGPNSRLA